MKTDLIECTRCDFSTSSARIRGEHIYILPIGEHINARLTTGWCHKCRNVEPIEFLPRVNDVANELNIFKIRRAQLCKRGILSRIIDSKKTELANLDEMIQNTTRMLQFLQARKSPPRCMTCGGTSYELIVIPSPQPGATIDSGLIHPGCGGRLLVSVAPVIFNVEYEPKYYDSQGCQITDKHHAPSGRQMINIVISAHHEKHVQQLEDYLTSIIKEAGINATIRGNIVSSDVLMSQGVASTEFPVIAINKCAVWTKTLPPRETVISWLTWPRSVQDAVSRIIQDVGAEKLRNMLLDSGHRAGLSIGIRNDFGLWTGNIDLKKSCGDEGIHADDAAEIIISSLERALNQ